MNWIVIVLLAVFTLGCDGSVDIRGRVLDAANEPIADGDVYLGRPGESVAFEEKTDADGCFTVGGMVSPGVRDYFLTISAAGYQDYEGTYENSADWTLLVSLAAETSGEASTAKSFGYGESAPELERCP